jgi:hypothetical protein
MYVLIWQRGQCILFSVVFTSPLPRHHGSVWPLSVISLLLTNTVSRGRIQRKTWCMEPYAGVDYNINLRRLQLQHIYHGQPYARESAITLCQSRLCPPVSDLEFGLRVLACLSIWWETRRGFAGSKSRRAWESYTVFISSMLYILQGCRRYTVLYVVRGSTLVYTE